MTLVRIFRVVLFFLALHAVAVDAVSLYSEKNFSPLAADRRSYRVGDLVTVIIYEQASAVSSADTDATRKGSIDANANYNLKSWKAGAGIGTDFDGTGHTQRTGRVLAQLTTSVIEIAANGDLWVEGKQNVVVNEEKQIILLRGRVRPIDVTESNTVQSSRLADASISYTGDGVVGNRQKPAIWQQFLNLLGL